MVSDLEKKLEEIKEKKAEWGVGSKDAHDYMKAVSVIY